MFVMFWVTVLLEIKFFNNKPNTKVKYSNKSRLKWCYSDALQLNYK